MECKTKLRGLFRLKSLGMFAKEKKSFEKKIVFEFFCYTGEGVKRRPGRFFLEFLRIFFCLSSSSSKFLECHRSRIIIFLWISSCFSDFFGIFCEPRAGTRVSLRVNRLAGRRFSQPVLHVDLEKYGLCLVEKMGTIFCPRIYYLCIISVCLVISIDTMFLL